jgi:hypothetical protein
MEKQKENAMKCIGRYTPFDDVSLCALTKNGAGIVRRRFALCSMT